MTAMNVSSPPDTFRTRSSPTLVQLDSRGAYSRNGDERYEGLLRCISTGQSKAVHSVGGIRNTQPKPTTRTQQTARMRAAWNELSVRVHKCRMLGVCVFYPPNGVHQVHRAQTPLRHPDPKRTEHVNARANKQASSVHTYRNDEKFIRYCTYSFLCSKGMYDTD